MPKMGQELIDTKQFVHERNIQKELVINRDSSAAEGILCRNGIGKVEHLEVRDLWLQDNINDGTLRVQKIPRQQNAADALTHQWTRPVNSQHFRAMDTSL